MLFDSCRPNKLNSGGAGAMDDVGGGVSGVSGGGSLRSNHDSTMACHSQSEVGEWGVGSFHRSCTQVCMLSELDNC